MSGLTGETLKKNVFVELLPFANLAIETLVINLLVSFVALRPSQQLWSLRDGQFT